MTTLDIVQYVVIIGVVIVGVVGFIMAVKSEDKDK